MLCRAEEPSMTSPTPPDEEDIAAAIHALLADRADDASICPSEVARLLAPNDWRPLMPHVRAVAFALARQAKLLVTQGSSVVAAGTLARGKRTAENPTALEAKYRDIQNQPTWTGKATRTAGTVAGHFIAQVLSRAAQLLEM
jgi:hypothetical protein